MKARPQRVRDPIHNLIEFDVREFEQMCWGVVQTPQFQRLRRIKQLGFSEFVYPGATHSRFSHSIGVFHVARQLARVIERISGDGYDKRRAQEAIAAALVHDLGHGPFSHAFEDVLKKLQLGQHEEKSVQLIIGTEVAEKLNDFSPNFSDRVADIIRNKVPDDIYASIVSSQFDADRLDYMRRDRFMTGTQSSAIDFAWLLANLDVRRVNIGQDDEKVREIETLVVGQKALLAAEAYVLGLFHLYPTVYYHKATRAAEKMLSALLMRLFELVIDGSLEKTSLPQHHPLAIFAKSPESVECFLDLDDHVVWAALGLLGDADDCCLSDLSNWLLDRRLYKVIDISDRLQTAYSGESLGSRREKIKKAEALIREELSDSGLLQSTDSAPKVLDDVVIRDPYRHGQGEEAALDMIYAVDRADELRELSELSNVVAALTKYETYRVYFREGDEDTRRKLNQIIEEHSK